MDTEDLTVDEKCENLMNVVVETRKRFGKLCADYGQKSTLMETKLLNLRLETISNYNFKPKNALPVLDFGDMSKDVDDFTKEIREKSKRIARLTKQIKNTQNVVLQLRGDTIGQKTRQPLTAEVMLARAKNKMI